MTTTNLYPVKLRNNAYKTNVSLIFILLLLCNRIFMVDSRSLVPKGNKKFEILLVKVFSLKQKISKILSATIKKVKFFLFKETASCSFRLYTVEISNQVFK